LQNDKHLTVRPATSIGQLSGPISHQSGFVSQQSRSRSPAGPAEAIRQMSESRELIKRTLEASGRFDTINH
jgi:hypothetical protein